MSHQLKNKITIGLWPLSGDWAPVNSKQSIEVVRHAYECGFCAFDVAPNYGNGTSEKLIGRLIAEGVSPCNLSIDTKVGSPVNGRKDFSLDNIKNSLKSSCLRLGVIRLRNIYLHNPRNETVDYQSIRDYMDRLADDRMIEAFGISGAKGYNYSDKLAYVRLLQQDLNIIYLRDLQSYLSAHNSGNRSTSFVARSVFASGLLTKQHLCDLRFTTGDYRYRWFTAERAKAIQHACSYLKKLLKTNDLRQISLRYALYHPDVSSVVLGVSSKSHIDYIQSALTHGPLTHSEVELIEAAWSTQYEYTGDYSKNGY